MTKIEHLNAKRGKQHCPRSHPEMWWRYVRLETNILITHLWL